MKPENEKIEVLAIKDFAKKIICDGHLYLRTNEGRRFYLMKPGIFIDQNFIKKYAVSQTVFDYSPVTNQNIINGFTSLFRELKYLQFEKDLRLKSTEIVSKFKEVFTSKEHFLSFALACHQEFCSISPEDVSRMHETDIHLFRKALYSAAFSVIVGLANDFYHYPMIKDFYNVTFGLDIGLCESHYSYFVAEACNRENQNPGNGRGWMMEERAAEVELSVFLNHPEKSYEFFKRNNSLLAFPELAEVALYQHELADGSGFPRGIPKGQVSGWEAVVILSDALVEIRDEYTFEQDVLDYLFSFQNRKLTDLPVQRVFKKLCMSLGKIEMAKGAAS